MTKELIYYGLLLSRLRLAINWQLVRDRLVGHRCSSQSHVQLTSHGKFPEIYQKFFCLFTTLTFNSMYSVCALRCICQNSGVTDSVMPCPVSGAQLSTEHQKIKGWLPALRQKIARSHDNKWGTDANKCWLWGCFGFHINITLLCLYYRWVY